MRTLIFDFEYSGHHSEYIDHLLLFLRNRSNENNEYFFVLHPNIQTKISSLREIDDAHCLQFMYLDPAEIDIIGSYPLWKKSFMIFQLMDRYARQLKVDNAILMSLNIFQLAIAFKNTSYKISGILFNQFSRIDKDRHKYQYYRKYFQTKLLLSNKSLKSVFLLNDQESVDSLNRQFKTSIFKVLIDPIPNYTPISNFDIYKEYSIDKGRKIFLHIGALDYRKGSLDILNSIQYLADDILNKIHILYVGLAKDGLKFDLIVKKQEISHLNLFTWDESFVDNEKMRSLFDQCHIVLMPYKNSEASSGILGHAANSNKPVIATGKGLLKELVLKYNLGSLVDDVTPENIGKAISQAANRGIEIGDTKSFVTLRSPTAFAKKLLE